MTKVAKESKKNSSGSKKKDAGAEKSQPAAVPAERWSEQPDEHDYPAAASFLSLVCEPTEVRKLVTALKGAPIVRHQAKDLLRASGLALLPVDDVHVASDLAKIDRGESLSPVLLVRGDVRRGVALTIADGYHRVCASYHVDENADIPCHLVDHRGPTPVPAFRQRSGTNSGAAPRAVAPAPVVAPAPGPAPAPGVAPGSAPGAAPLPDAAPASTDPSSTAPIPAPDTPAPDVPAPRPGATPQAGATTGTGFVPGDGEERPAPG